jgi:hypothetical protein
VSVTVGCEPIVRTYSIIVDRLLPRPKSGYDGGLRTDCDRSAAVVAPRAGQPCVTTGRRSGQPCTVPPLSRPRARPQPRRPSYRRGRSSCAFFSFFILTRGAQTGSEIEREVKLYQILL